MSTLVNGFGNYGIHNPPTCNIHTASPFWTSLVPWVRNLAANPSFETGAGPWTGQEPPPTTNYMTYNNGTAKSGLWYLQMNTQVVSGSIFQDITTESSSTGDSYIFTIWARAPGSFNCVQVNLVLWALWGSNESGPKS